MEEQNELKKKNQIIKKNPNIQKESVEKQGIFKTDNTIYTIYIITLLKSS